MDKNLEKIIKGYEFKKFPVKTVEDYNRLIGIVLDICKKFGGPICPGDIITLMGYTEDEKNEIDKIGYDSLMI